MAISLRALTPTLLSLVLPLLLRTYQLTLEPHAIFLPIGVLALIWEKGYRETLETLSPELSEHTGPFSHVGVCILSQIFVENIPSWRGEILFWTVFVRWAFGLCKRHRAGIKEFKHAYWLRFNCAEARMHAVLVATLATPLFVTKSMPTAQTTAIWLHFYHCVGSMIAAGTYFFVPQREKKLVEIRRKREVLNDAHPNECDQCEAKTASS